MLLHLLMPLEHRKDFTAESSLLSASVARRKTLVLQPSDDTTSIPPSLSALISLISSLCFLDLSSLKCYSSDRLPAWRASHFIFCAMLTQSMGVPQGSPFGPFSFSNVWKGIQSLNWKNKYSSWNVTINTTQWHSDQWNQLEDKNYMTLFWRQASKSSLFNMTQANDLT